MRLVSRPSTDGIPGSISKNTIMKKEKVKCADCDKLFRDRYNLWRHFLRAHVPGREKRKKSKADKPKPTCPHCGQVFYKNGNLKRHSNLCKKIKSSPLSCEEYTFSNDNSFQEWKHKIEIETKARFVRKSHYKLQNGSFRTKYCCHRSGFFRPQGKNVRRLKSLGSNKINGICPAKIISIARDDGKVEVSFYPDHNGHSMELERITLSKAERAQIADKIAKKIPFKEILNNVKNSHDSEFNRLHLLNKKDLYNIEKEFNINSISYSYDNIAVDYFLNESQNAISSAAEPLRFTDKPTSSLHLTELEQAESNAINCTPIAARTPESTQSPQVQQVAPVCSPSAQNTTSICPEVQQVTAVNSPELQQQTFIVQVPFSIDSVQENYAVQTSSHDVNSIENLKEEMRREFELVLSSIGTKEQAEKGKKWVSAFHSFVHSTHFPLQITNVDSPQLTQL